MLPIGQTPLPPVGVQGVPSRHPKSKGARAERIMDHTGHASVAMVRVYTRRADAFADHAGEGLL